jgi:hypothetical protein
VSDWRVQQLHYLLQVLLLILVFAGGIAAEELHIYVDPVRGNDAGRGRGAESQPVRTLAAAIALVPEHVSDNVTVHLASGIYESTGGAPASDDQLILERWTASDAWI